uniref:Uncharacterized protein n=1 Tax=Mastacembelus armatus TaxID=205130 RepID=A0A3Q3L6A0_9TELE
MCTTIMVLTTVAVILRQMFSNKIKPLRGYTKEPQGPERDTLVILFCTSKQQRPIYSNL